MTIEEINLRIQKLKAEIDSIKTEIENVNLESRRTVQNLRNLNDEIKRLPGLMSLKNSRNRRESDDDNEHNLIISQDLKNLLKVELYQIGLYTLHVKKRQLHYKDDMIVLTRKEMFLLIIFAANQNVFVERDYCLTTVWSISDYRNSRSMDVYICKLRKYLYKDNNINLINKHGKGYLMHVKK